MSRFIGTAGASYCAEAVAFFNRLATAPTTARAQQYDTLIRALVNSGVWAKLDCLWVLAAADTATAIKNLVSTSHSLTEVNSPAFVADRGYTSDGSTSYLSGPNIFTFGGQYVQDNAHLGVYVGTNVSAANKFDAGNGNLSINPRNSTVMQTRINASAADNVTPPATLSSVGHSCLSRDNSANFDAYKNGTLVANTARTSAAPTSAVLLVCQSGGNFSTRQVSACHIGGALTALQVAVVNSSLSTYLQSIGAPTP